MQGYRRSAPNEQGTVNTQILPPWILTRWGDEALDTRARVEWDVEPAKDRLAEANSLEQTAKAGEALRKFLKKFGRELDINQLTNQFGVAMVPGDGAADLPTSTAGDLDPADLETFIDLLKSHGLRPTNDTMTSIAESFGIDVETLPGDTQTARLELAPTDVAKVVRVDEARLSQGLAPIGDERGNKTISELTEDAKAAATPSDDATASDSVASTIPAPAIDKEAA